MGVGVRAFALVSSFLLGSLAVTAMAEHTLVEFPPMPEPDARLVLVRRHTAEGTYLCGGSFIRPKSAPEDRAYLAFASHCVGDNDSDTYSYLTRYHRIEKGEGKHSKEGSFKRSEVALWQEPDIAVVELPKAALLDAKEIPLADRVPTKWMRTHVLAFPAADAGGFGPFDIECVTHGTGLFIGRTSEKDPATHGKALQDLLCPWIVAPAGISGAPALNGNDELVGIVTSSINTGGGFHTTKTIVLRSRRSKSHLFFAPFLNSAFSKGTFVLDPTDGPKEDIATDGGEVKYTILNGKLEGTYTQVTEGGDVLSVELKQGLLHGVRKLTDREGKVLHDASYENGIKKTK